MNLYGSDDTVKKALRIVLLNDNGTISDFTKRVFGLVFTMFQLTYACKHVDGSDSYMGYLR